jgi:rubrerythrin
MKPQDFRCHSCGHQWLGTSSTCPRCDGVAKSEGEMTKKVLDEPDMKKGLR